MSFDRTGRVSRVRFLAGTASALVFSATKGVQAQALADRSMQPAIVELGGTVRGFAFDSDISGLSYEKHTLTQALFHGENTALIAAHKKLGRGPVRICGASVESLHWQARGKGRTAGEIAPRDIEALTSFLCIVERRATYGIALIDNTPTQAAAEARYVFETLGTFFEAFELGDRPDRRQESRTGVRHFLTYKAYRRRYAEFVAAIRRAVPQARFIGPSVTADAPDFLERFAADETHAPLSALSQYGYRFPGGDSLDRDGRTFVDGDAPQAATVATALASILGSAAASGIAQTRIVISQPPLAPEHANTIDAALFALDQLSALASVGIGKILFHGSGADAFAPIADTRGIDVRPRALYLGLAIFARLGRGRITNIGEATLDPSMRAYAIEHADGSKSVLAINTSREHVAMLEIRPQGGVRRVDRSVFDASFRADTKPTYGTSQPVTASGRYTEQLAPSTAMLVTFA